MLVKFRSQTKDVFMDVDFSGHELGILLLYSLYMYE